MINTTNFKEMLEAEKEDLTRELAAIAIFNTETNLWEAVPDKDLMNEIDDNDAADRFEDFEARSSMSKTFQDKLTDVNDALAKIEAGTYGICEVSREPIEEDRLAANPAARTNKAHMNDR